MVCCLFPVHQGLLQRVMGKKAWTSHRLGHSDSALVCDRVHICHRWTRGNVPGEADRKISWEVSGGPSAMSILCIRVRIAAGNRVPLSPAEEIGIPEGQGAEIGYRSQGKVNPG